MKEYYADKRISQSKLKDFIKCPNYYKAKHVDKVIDPQPTQAMIFGSVVDLLVTSPEVDFDKEFVVVDKVFKADPVDEQGRRRINNTTYKNALSAAQKVRKQPVMEMFSWMDNQVALYDDKRKALLDYFGIDEKGEGWIADLKTMQDIDKIEYTARDFGWIYQLAYYRYLAKKLYPEVKKWHVYIIGIDKTATQKFGVWRINQKPFRSYECMIRAQLMVIGKDIKVSKGLCRACPPEIDCRFSLFSKKDIGTL